jgi:hypothetical protein
MAVGRKTGGRQRGTKNKRLSLPKQVQQNIAAAIEDGLTPLEFMVRTMRDTSVDWPIRAEMAKNAAPYMHPKLMAVATADMNKPIIDYTKSPEQLKQELIDSMVRMGIIAPLEQSALPAPSTTEPIIRRRPAGYPNS